MLESRDAETEPNKIIEDLIDDFEDYFFTHTEESIFRHKLENIENKIDHLLEKNSERNCRFSKEGSESVIQLITGIGSDERNKAISHLEEKLIGTKTLTVCDPYFIKGIKGIPSTQVANQFVTLLPKTLKILELYVKPRVREKEFADSLNKELKNREIKLVVRKTDDVHDRVWIKDYDEAFVVGTSFNGLGNKCAFILDLPPEDRKQFIFSLSDLARKLPKSKSA